MTVNFIKEGISQLRAVDASGSRAQVEMDLWRGLKNLRAQVGCVCAVAVSASRGALLRGV